ncbi:MAG: hypothetical protein HZA24_01875 [Nitrospirae bacterium]|nr:hypothetical protein [Nitrospirota bacterium]
MTDKRRVEVFSAGCPVCEEAVRLVERLACPACAVSVLDMRAPAVAAKAADLGVRALPAVAVDGRLAQCCAGAGVDEARLRAAGVGRAL